MPGVFNFRLKGLDNYDMPFAPSTPRRTARRS
jgi:hypothetical protein